MERNGSLDELPYPARRRPDDGGPYITFPLVFTKGSGRLDRRNIGTYRMQVFDGRTTGMHWQRHKGGGAAPSGRRNAWGSGSMSRWRSDP